MTKHGIVFVDKMPVNNSWLGRAACAAAVCVSLVSAASAIDVEVVPVGNVDNAGELSGAGADGGAGEDRVCGAVDYTYSIGKYEVTSGQYTEFLNAVAATDAYALYNVKMETGGKPCGIARTGSSGSYAYSVAAGWADRPVTFISSGDAVRFAN